MPRKPQTEYASAVYHMTCGNRREEIFQDDVGREMLLELMGEVCERTGRILHSFVLMPNHNPWLVKSHTTMPDRWVAETLATESRSMVHHAVHCFRSPASREEKTLKHNLTKLTT